MHYLNLHFLVPFQPKCRCRFSIVRPVEGHTRLEVEEEGLAVLRSISGPVVPVIVIGPYRSGKSFLLNQLLGVGCGMILFWLGLHPKALPADVMVQQSNAMQGLG